MCEKSNLNCKNWNFRVEKQLNLMNLDTEDRNAIKLIEERMFESFKEDWVNQVGCTTFRRKSFGRYDLWSHTTFCRCDFPSSTTFSRKKIAR